MLEIESLNYRYRNGHQALQNISMSVKPGILGLLGPNGAGKSSLMRILATLATSQSGRVLWRGVDIARQPDLLRAELGYLPQDFGVYPNLSALEFLTYMAAVKGVKPSDCQQQATAVLQQVGLAKVSTQYIGQFSGGMKQRIGIAQALLNNPALLIVDEPTVGLDPEERMRFRHLLTDLSAERLVILSTHIVSDIEAIATDLAVLVKGQLHFHGAPERLIQQANGQVWQAVIHAAQLPQLRQQYYLSHSERRPDGLLVRLIAPQQPLPQATLVVPDLESAYIYLLQQVGGATADLQPLRPTKTLVGQ